MNNNTHSRTTAVIETIRAERDADKYEAEQLELAIKTGLGGQIPKIFWYISPELIDYFPLDLLALLTNDPNLDADFVRLNNGGCVYMVFASKVDETELQKLIANFLANTQLNENSRGRHPDRVKLVQLT